MEIPSQAPHSGDSHWNGLLITASILICWMQPTSAQSDSVTVAPNPPYGTVGSSVILDIQEASGQVVRYDWYRSTTDSNPIALYLPSFGSTSTDSRLNMFSNGSLLISSLTLSDSDDYIVLIITLPNFDTVRGQTHLVVYEIASKPNITASSTNVIENSTVVFTCVTEHEGMGILWFFNDALLSLNERKSLSENNETLTIETVARGTLGPINVKSGM